MIDPRDLRIDDIGPPAVEPPGRGLRADGGDDAGPAGRERAGDGGNRSRLGMTNQHSFADEEFEVDTAQNYHGADDPA